MEVVTRRLDNRLTLQIPENFATELGFEPDREVSVTTLGGAIIMRQAREPNLLDKLLEQVDESNLPGETSTGPASGREEW